MKTKAHKVYITINHTEKRKWYHRVFNINFKPDPITGLIVKAVKILDTKIMYVIEYNDGRYELGILSDIEILVES